jgi:carbon-monoxide dehydrogenase large subunit
MSRHGIGASVPRKEDDRLMRGRGEFVADIRLPGMRELAFVRQRAAHARIRGIRKNSPAVYTIDDLHGVRPITAVSSLPGFRASDQPVLARDKVRHVGEAIAVCVADTRAEAEDLAAAVEVDLEELPAVVDMLHARDPGTPLRPWS